MPFEIDLLFDEKNEDNDDVNANNAVCAPLFCISQDPLAYFSESDEECVHGETSGRSSLKSDAEETNDEDESIGGAKLLEEDMYSDVSDNYSAWSDYHSLHERDWQMCNTLVNVRLTRARGRGGKHHSLRLKRSASRRSKTERLTAAGRKDSSRLSFKRLRRESMSLFSPNVWESGLSAHLFENKLYILYSTIRAPRVFDIAKTKRVFQGEPRPWREVPSVVLEFDSQERLELECESRTAMQDLLETLQVNFDLLHKKNKRLSRRVSLGMKVKMPGGAYSPYAVFEACETGDILLYRTKRFTGNITRTFTQKQWDHIGIFVWVNIDGERTLGVLEALADKGTQLWPWRSYIEQNWHQDYSNIAVRHLRVPNEELKSRIHYQLKFFVQKAIDRPYSLIREFLQRGSRSIECPERTFFCSSLVAKAYKTVGLLQQNISSNKYYPGHFHHKSGIAILQGCELSQPIDIDFELSPENLSSPSPSLHSDRSSEDTTASSQKSKLQCSIM